MFIKRDGKALALVFLDEVTFCDGYGVMTLTASNRADGGKPTTFTITLLQHEVLQIARAYDAMVSEEA